MAEPITASALGLDLSARIVASKTVVASPALAAETVIATVELEDDPTIVSGILVMAFAAYTIGTSGTAANLRIRQTGLSGALIVSTGDRNVTAGNEAEISCDGFDTAPIAGNVYAATLQIANGAAASTVSAVSLVALAI